MTKRLFSTAKKRRPYRPRGYRSVFATDVDPETEEETTSEVSEEEVGLSADEFTGDLTDDPLADLADESIWAVTPGTDEDYSVTEDDFEREEAMTNTSSRLAYKGFPYDDLHNQPFIPGHKWPTYLYRGLAIKVPSDVEGELDFAMMEGDQQGVFQVGRKILDIIGRSGLGRHWTTEPDVAMDFANMNKSSGNIVVVLSALWERDGEDFAAEHEGYDGVVRPSRLVGEEEVTLKPGTKIKLLSMRGSRVLNGSLMERNFDIEFLSSPEMRTASQLVASDGVLDSLNPTGTIFTEYAPEDRAGLELAPHIRPYSEVNGVDPDERMVVYRGVPKGVQSELADGDFITDMEQLAKDYAGYPYGDVISQEVFADEILDDMEYPMSGEYLFRPRRASKKTAQDYFMEHRPAGPEDGSPLHDLNDTYPDIYDSPHYYDFGEPGNKDSFSAIQRAKGNPEEMVTMYRSIPPDGTPSFAPGDWVSTSGDYARQHSLSENEEDDDFIVMEQQVPASSLWSEGNSVAEWGYHGDALDGTISEKYTPKKTLERLRSQKTSSRRTAGPVISEPMTLYRGEGSHDQPSYYPPASGMAGGWWTSDVDSARSYAQGQNGDVYEIDVEPGEAEQRGLPKYFFIEDQKVRERRRPFVSRTANSDFPALPEDFVRNISPDGFDSRWSYETTGYEPRSSDDRYDLSINPVNSPAVIPGEENGLRKKPIFYDPERTELEWDELFGHSPTRQDRDLSHLAPPEGLLWRGMSNEEYENAKRDGYFQSKGDWNFEGQEGETYFSTDPDAAANYANDFAPIQFKPGFGNPAHVIGIPDRPELPRYEHEVGVPGQIPFSDVVQHYTGHPTAISPGSSSYFNDISTGEWSEGGGMGPSVSLAWEPGEGYEPKTSRRNPGGFSYDTPVPDIKVRAHRRTPERKKDPMTAIDRYLRYASRRGMDPKSKSTLRAFARSDRGTSKTAQRDISRWFVAQEVAHDTARDVLASSRNYRRKISSSWHLDNKLSAYVSKVQQKFACSCGAKLDVPAYNICKCGKIWNAYKVHSATKGDTMYVVREVPVRENVLVAGRGKTASRRRQAQGWEGARGNGWETPAADLGAISDEELLEFVVNVQNAADAGANIGTIMDNKKGHFVSELISRGWRVDKTGIPYREARRRQAYDVEDDTYDFFEKARDRGYRFPKNMGDDPDSGTFQDELHNYTGGDRDRMRQVTDFARDNWGQHRHFDPYYNR